MCKYIIDLKMLYLCDNLEGWMGLEVEGRLKREGIFVYLELIKLWYSKNYHTVKQLYSNGKIK